MAGFYHGDPYFPLEGNGGWIDPDSEEEPSEAESDEEPIGHAADANMDQAADDEDPIENEPEEAAVEEEPIEANDDDDEEDVQQLVDEVFEEVEVEEMEESDSELEVDDPRYPIRSRDEPLPPPSSQTYQLPGGLMWKYTPRKSIPPIRRQDVFTFSMPTQDASAGTSAAGASTAGTSTAGTSAAVAYPDLVRNVARLDAHAHSTARQLINMGADIQVSGARVRRMDANLGQQERTIVSLREGLNTAQAEIRQLRDTVANLVQTTQEATRQAREATEEVRAFMQRLSDFFGLPD